MDFTILTHRNLIDTLRGHDFYFQTFAEFIDKPKYKSIVLRHDVDDRKENSLLFAKTLNEIGIAGTFYFRVVPQSFDEKIIKEIYSFGHEIGYHYETMDTCRGNLDKAYDEFCRNLEMLRKLVPILTACMHGSPTSKYDNRVIWKKYDFRKLGIIAELYFDVDFEDVLYLTDTGRRWNGYGVSIRDKGLGIRGEAQSSERSAHGDNNYDNWKVKPVKGSLMNMTPKSVDFQNEYRFRSTSEIISAALRGELPDQMMMTFHPQRWTDKPVPWLKELVLQNVKNVGKYFLIKRRTTLDARHREKS